eukprot:1825020-Pleurochrysis_carterae.AAC.1
MGSYGRACPLSSKSNHAPGSWYAARTEALRRYSIKHFGIRPQAPDSSAQQQGSFSLAEPQSWFRLRARPDHSNYPECQECRDRRLSVEGLINAKAPRAEMTAMREKQMQHIQNMFAERDVIAELENDVHRSTKIVFTTDDKLGSHWQFLPMPANERFGKKTAGRWRYR